MSGCGSAGSSRTLSQLGRHWRRIAEQELLPEGTPPTPTSTPEVPPTATPTGTPTATPSPTPTDTPAAPTAPCVGDIGGDGAVTVDELITGVNCALGTTGAALTRGVSSCGAFDSNQDQAITVDELITAVNNALNGCPQ